MEWTLEVNEILKNDITKITNSLIPPGFEGDSRSIRLMQDSLSKLVNQLGEQSASAQGLNKVITTAEKLRTADSHTLYLLKDANARGGKGQVLGMLKVGRKHLFLFDEKELVREVEPLCVLDFFVLGEYQRHGVGKALFDYMLKDMETTAHRLAVDGPSSNMVAFLHKNYGVTSLLRQSNNFAVSPLFFKELAPYVSKAGGGGSEAAAAGGGVGRYTAPKPHSSIGKVIHGGIPFSSTSAPSLDPARPSRKAAARDGHPAHPATRGEDGRCETEAPSPSRSRCPSAAASPCAGVAAAGEARRSPSRPRTLPVSVVAEAAPAPPVPARAPAPPAPSAPSAEPTPAGAPSRRDSQLTDQGFFDVKFYHKKLW